MTATLFRLDIVSRGDVPSTNYGLDEIVAWREIRKYVVMSQEFCPGL